jgi:hypothetical protein
VLGGVVGDRHRRVEIEITPNQRQLQQQQQQQQPNRWGDRRRG